MWDNMSMQLLVHVHTIRKRVSYIATASIAMLRNEMLKLNSHPEFHISSTFMQVVFIVEKMLKFEIF